ncbi:MAG: helix-turn-helix domain-containing protein [Ancalomicrobiaceae bacterium]|nr:helix-turn-helix domain-containing protein [Ancalomicrobiaceae bacterium]
MSEYMTVKEAAAFIGVSASYLNKLRCLTSTGPRFVKLGKAVRYSTADVRAWMDANVRRSTSDEMPGATERTSAKP